MEGTAEGPAAGRAHHGEGSKRPQQGGAARQGAACMGRRRRIREGTAWRVGHGGSGKERAARRVSPGRGGENGGTMRELWGPHGKN